MTPLLKLMCLVSLVGFASLLTMHLIPIRWRAARQLVLSFGVALFITQMSLAQGQYYGVRETPTKVPSYKGTAANAPIPSSMHSRNEGGSDGAGLCVISSLRINGRYQGVPNDELERLWQTAKSRPGGYSPGKLQDVLDEVAPDEKWASYVGTDPTVLHKLSSMGYPIGSTMNTGELYQWQPIHHMISLVHFDRERDLACVVDNNQPGVFSWMTSREYLRRWVDGGTGWAFVWLRKAPADLESLALLLLAGGAIAFVFLARRRRPAPTPMPAQAIGLFDDWGNPREW